jgi:MAP/microtubule affinity-regulating kinase
MPNDNGATANAGQKRPTSADRRNSGSANPDMNLTGIGNYLFQRTIGQGNFAKVKLAKHKLTSQEVPVFPFPNYRCQ